ncbi:MAG: hypothetical protein KatS3mg085_018 [Candidatus Dojkabacteria bacterium]|nr:MAG: hypothetical protein KatS3mg085_018 [Candidatus Dojkabacteria bacterium]
MITQITLKNYRNITDFDSTLKKINLIVAPNGAGKTNLLESIFFLFNGTSFKSMRSMLDAVGPNEDFSTVKIILQKNICEMVIIKSPNLKKQYKKNNKKTNLKQIYKILKPVIFSPNSVDLVDGAPEVRRKDLDLFIASFDYQYSDALTRYEKVLKNKNAILKNIRDGNSTIEQLEFWNNELCQNRRNFSFKKNKHN